MTRKTAIKILAAVTILALIFIGYLIISSYKTVDNDSDGKIDTTNNGYTLPVSNNTGSSTNTADGSVPTSLEEIKSIPTLRQIVASPISGFTTFERLVAQSQENIPESKRNQTETIYRYVDRATGNVFETTENSLKIDRITNTTVPKVYEASFFTAGDGVVLRYLDANENIETFVAKILSKTSTTTAEENESPFSLLQGSFLPKNVVAITKSPTEDKFFYTKDGKGYTFNGSSPQNQTLIMDYAITEWLANWVNKQIILTTKPSYFSEGFAFSLDPVSGSLNIIQDDRLGLLVNQNSNQTKMLVSEYKNDSITTSIVDLKTNETKGFGLRTFAEKCVWSKKNTNLVYCAVPRKMPAGPYPDMWYQGTVSFTDELYKIDLDLNTTSKFESISKYAFDIDGIQLSEQEEYILFQNKKDLSLWSLDITK